jgi:hypothetical protein
MPRNSIHNEARCPVAGLSRKISRKSQTRSEIQLVKPRGRTRMRALLFLDQLQTSSLARMPMSPSRPHRIAKSWPAPRWSWFPPALALLAMLLPMMGCQASAQLQSLRLAASSSSEEGENEFPGGDDSVEGDLEAHLLRRSPREFLPPGIARGTCERLAADGHSASRVPALDRERDAAACSAARLPLRC